MSESTRNDASWDQRTIHRYFTAREAEDILGDLPGGHRMSQATRDFMQWLHDSLREKPPEGDVMPDDTDIVFAPIQPVKEAPAKPPRRGLILCERDITGISGLGVIAEFCVFSDDFTVIRWLGGPPQYQPKHEIYDNRGIEPFEQVSGHHGATKVIWIDEDDEDPAREPTPETP